MDHSAKEILALSNEATECPICHLRFKKNKTFASGCLHCYCYQCIQKWVQRQATCPLCRKPVEYLITNVESNEDYDIEEVVPPTNDNLDREDDSELSGESDFESQRNASTASLESISDTSDESDVQSSIRVSNASDPESNEDVLSEDESNGNVSDRVDYDTESEEDWNDGLTESEQDGNDNLIESEQDWNDGLTESEHEFDRGMSDYECDSEISDHESDEDISSGLPNYSGNSEDESNELVYYSSETSVSPISSSDQDSDLLSSDDRFSVEPSSVSDFDSDDNFSSSSDY